jgi:uncharacterized RDD family membrane protein YckC
VADLKLDVTTPERVAIDLPIAGIGYRVLAYLVDVLALLSVSLVLYFAYSFIGPSAVELYQDAPRVLKVIALVAGFVVLWVYWTAMEVFWNGQTLGKRVMHIRVVRKDGSPVTAFESAVRNLLRVVDFMPACYPVGVVTMLIDAQHRRIGDLVAGTLLIRDERIGLEKYAEAAPASALSTQNVELVTGYLARFDTLDAAAREALGRKLAASLGLPAKDAEALTAEQAKAWLSSKLKGG